MTDNNTPGGGMGDKTAFIEIGRKPGETDEDWAAVCKDMARALAKATGMEHLLPKPGDPA